MLNQNSEIIDSSAGQERFRIPECPLYTLGNEGQLAIIALVEIRGWKRVEAIVAVKHIGLAQYQITHRHCCTKLYRLLLFANIGLFLLIYVNVHRLCGSSDNKTLCSEAISHLLIETRVGFTVGGACRSILAIPIHMQAILQAAKCSIVGHWVLVGMMQKPIVIIDGGVGELVVGAKANDGFMMVERTATRCALGTVRLMRIFSFLHWCPHHWVTRD
mmetsp:Transcript_107178/g.189814  ORF Transcript_107178/g.189814 Transcript_107178/m.189814 type:complete len:217 (-) Transcript_107178:135-785(-)